jgi:hypothetical protein
MNAQYADVSIAVTMTRDGFDHGRVMDYRSAVVGEEHGEVLESFEAKSLSSALSKAADYARCLAEGRVVFVGLSIVELHDDPKPTRKASANVFLADWRPELAERVAKHLLDTAA